MRAGIGPQPTPAAAPTWAWYQWESSTKARPDLRCSGHLSKGETGMLVEFEMDESEVLLSDFELWHYVLNYQYLPCSMKDSRRFDAILEDLGVRTPADVATGNRSFHSAVQESWSRIFDLHWSEPEIATNFGHKSVQATLWRLQQDRIRKATVFNAR